MYYGTPTLGAPDVQYLDGIATENMPVSTTDSWWDSTSDFLGNLWGSAIGTVGGFADRYFEGIVNDPGKNNLIQPADQPKDIAGRADVGGLQLSTPVLVGGGIAALALVLYLVKK